MPSDEESKLLGPIAELMADPTIADVMINGTTPVYIERKGVITRTDIRFESDEAVIKLIHAVFRAAGKIMDPAVGWGDVCMSDGSRVNAVIPPLSRLPLMTIRKSAMGCQGVEDLVKLGTITAQAGELLVACIKGRLNILFSGGTGTGKTTTLKVLCGYIEPHERIICIEDTAELNLQHEHAISLEAHPGDSEHKAVSLRDLIRNSLRMRPDRIVVGEIRSAEALDLIEAMSVGHNGCLSIVHGNSPADVLSRLEMMILRSSANMAIRDVRRQIASTVDLIVHQERLTDGSRRVTYISEIEGVVNGELQLHNIFTFETEGVDEEGRIVGELKATYSHFPDFVEKFRRLGIDSSKAFFTTPLSM